MTLTESSSADDHSSVGEQHVDGGGDNSRPGASQFARVGTKVAPEGDVTDRVHLSPTSGDFLKSDDSSQVVPETPEEADEEDDSATYSVRHLAAVVSVPHYVTDGREGHLAAADGSRRAPGEWNALDSAVYEVSHRDDAMVGAPGVLRADGAGDSNSDEEGVKRVKGKFSEYYPSDNSNAPAIYAQPSQALTGKPNKSQRWHGDNLWFKSRRMKAEHFTDQPSGLPDKYSSPQPGEGLVARKSFGAKVLHVIQGWKQARNHRMDSEHVRSIHSESPLKTAAESFSERKLVTGRLGVRKTGSNIDRGMAADAYAVLGKAWRGGFGVGSAVEDLDGDGDGVGDGEDGVWGMAKMYLWDQPPAGPLEPIMEEEAEEVDPVAWMRLQMAEFEDWKSPPRSLSTGSAAQGGKSDVAELPTDDGRNDVGSFGREAKAGMSWGVGEAGGRGMSVHRRTQSTGSILSETSESEMETLRLEAMRASHAHASATEDAQNSMRACLCSLSNVAASLDEVERQYSESSEKVHATCEQLQKDVRVVDSAVQQAAADRPWGGGWRRTKSSTQHGGGQKRHNQGESNTIGSGIQVVSKETDRNDPNARPATNKNSSRSTTKSFSHWREFVRF